MSEPQDKAGGSTAAPQSESYYTQGSSELATESALLLSKLSQRLELTKVDQRLVVVLVGLPGRGKSFIARKLQNFLQWIGTDCKIFNVGKYRRQAEEGKNAGAEFFDAKNERASVLRQEVARLALEDMLRWIDEPFVGDGGPRRRRSVTAAGTPKASRGRVGIYDATNSTKDRRDWVLSECTDEVKREGKHTGVVFVESVCDDADLMRENFITKVTTSPDYAGVPLEDALADIMERSKKYEEAYETIDDDDISYIKIFNLSSKLMVNHIYGMLARSVVPALMSWNIGTRPVYLCRPSAEGHPTPEVNVKKALVNHSSRRQTLVMSKKESLDVVGEVFRDALLMFMRKECFEFAERRKCEKAKNDADNKAGGGRRRKRGTLVAPGGMMEALAKSGGGGGDYGPDEPFPCCIETSTVPRACETVAWKGMTSRATSNLNPLDRGDFTGMSMEQIAEKDPEWYQAYGEDPFYTRFPGGECQADLMLRLEPVAIGIEQQVDPVLIVTHASVLQALLAYFRNSDAEECTNIDLPLDTVFKFTPAKGGGWMETHHCILSDGDHGAEELDAIAE